MVLRPNRYRTQRKDTAMEIRQTPEGIVAFNGTTALDENFLRSNGFEMPQAGETMPVYYMIRYRGEVTLSVTDPENAADRPLYRTTRPAGSQLTLLLQLDSEGVHVVSLADGAADVQEDNRLMWEAAHLHDTINLLRTIKVRPIARAEDINVDGTARIVASRLEDKARRALTKAALAELRGENPELHDRLYPTDGSVFGRIFGRRTDRGQATIPLGARLFGPGYVRHAFWVETAIFGVLPSLIGGPAAWFGFLTAFVVLHFIDQASLDGTGVRVSVPKVLGVAALNGVMMAATASASSTVLSAGLVIALIWAVAGLLHAAMNGQLPTFSEAPEPTRRPGSRSIRRGAIHHRLLISLGVVVGGYVLAAALGLVPGRPAPAPVRPGEEAKAPEPKKDAPKAPDPVKPPAPVVPPKKDDGKKPPIVPPGAKAPDVAAVLAALAAQGEGERPFVLAKGTIDKLEAEANKAKLGVAYQARQWEIAKRQTAVAKREIAQRDRLSAPGKLHTVGVYQPSENNDAWLKAYGTYEKFEPQDPLWRVADDGSGPVEFADAASRDAFIAKNYKRIHIYLSHAAPAVVDHLTKVGFNDNGVMRKLVLGPDGELTDLSDALFLRRAKIDIEIWVGERKDRDVAGAARSYRLVTGKNAAIAESQRALEDHETRQRQIHLLESLLKLKGAGAAAPLPADVNPLLPVPIFGDDAAAGLGLVGRLPAPGDKAEVPAMKAPGLRDKLMVSISVAGTKRNFSLLDLGSVYAARSGGTIALQTPTSARRHSLFWKDVGPKVMEKTPGLTSVPAAQAAGALDSANRQASAVDMFRPAIAPGADFDTALQTAKQSGIGHWSIHAADDAGAFFRSLGEDDPYYGASALLAYLKAMADVSDESIAAVKGGSRAPAAPAGVDVKAKTKDLKMSDALRRDVNAVADKAKDYQIAYAGGERDGYSGVIKYEPAAKAILKTLGDAPTVSALQQALDHPKTLELATTLEQLDQLTIQILTHPDVVANSDLREALLESLDWRGAILREQIRRSEVATYGRPSAGKDAIRQQILNSILVGEGKNLPRMWATALEDVLKAAGADPAYPTWTAPPAPVPAPLAGATFRPSIPASVAPAIEKGGLPAPAQNPTVKTPPSTAKVQLTEFERPDVSDPGPWRSIGSDIPVVRGKAAVILPKDIVPGAKAGEKHRLPLLAPNGKPGPALPVPPAIPGETFDYAVVNQKGEAVARLTTRQFNVLKGTKDGSGTMGWLRYIVPSGRFGDAEVSDADLFTRNDPRRGIFVVDPERAPLALGPIAPIRAPFGPPAGPGDAAVMALLWGLAPGGERLATKSIFEAGGYEIIPTKAVADQAAADAARNEAIAKNEAALQARLKTTDDYLLTNRDASVYDGLPIAAEERIVKDAIASPGDFRFYLPKLKRYITPEEFRNPRSNTNVAGE
ncbi:MAG: hypothetical protein JO102_07090, partial [Elusimicrobia bacterium]|nr:hypothetical protein [Elusimicrobiota bacterium]